MGEGTCISCLLLCLKKSPWAKRFKRKSMYYGTVSIGQESTHRVVGSSTQCPLELWLHFDRTVFPSGCSTKEAQLSIQDSDVGRTHFPWLYD